ncbi:MAG TPA: ABC transporter permease [Terriglobales bacterium]|jgi:putative ABC transport system permease protein|nr:ABC transporter permease [Terriglobales bacterium]
MNTVEAIRLALQSLWANKLRSALTLLGVVIGVAAVIAVVTFVSGLNRYVAERIFRLGTDVFIVFKSSPASPDPDHVLEGEKRKNFTLDDYRAVLDACKQCTVVGASLRNQSGHIKFGLQAINDATVQGVTPSMGPIYDVDLETGRMLNETDLNNRSPVVVVGTDIVENLLSGADPIGKEIRVDGWTYQVVGVGVKKGKTLGQSLDNYVMMPITSYMKQYGEHQDIRISGKATGIGPALTAAMDEARVVLRSRRHDLPGADDSFDIETNASLLGIWSNLTGTFFIAMIGIASISLIVGGIVIMNMMLVAVTERTREIGVRKALGAKRQDVLLQFLIESVVLTVIGGAGGVAAGALVAKTVTLLIGMPSSLPVWVIPIALIVSGTIGVFFGVYPAKRAAMLDPIVALRFEL